MKISIPPLDEQYYKYRAYKDQYKYRAYKGQYVCFLLMVSLKHCMFSKYWSEFEMYTLLENAVSQNLCVYIYSENVVLSLLSINVK